MAILRVQMVLGESISQANMYLGTWGVFLSSIEVFGSVPRCPDTMWPAKLIPQYHLDPQNSHFVGIFEN
jgi:hypothetical protein